MNAFNDPNYTFKPIYITADDVKKSMEVLNRVVKFHVAKSRQMTTNVQVTFHIVGGRSKTFNLDTESELVHLNKGDTAEITHRQENWDGSYEVLEKIVNTSGIVYTLLLKSLELRHTHGGHNKRWLATTKDNGQTVLFRWGKIGGTLQSMEKVFPSYRAAACFIHEKIEEKLKKGYNQK